MEKPKRKPWATFYEDMLRLRRRRPDPKAVEKFNDLMKKDEEREKREREREKKIARPPSGEAST